MRKEIFIILLIFLILTPSVYAKSMHIKRVDVNISVNPDSSVSVKELLRVTFDGTFHHGYQYFNHDNVTLDNLKVFEVSNNNLVPINFKTDNSENTSRVDWYFDAMEENKDFLITYTLKRGVVIYNDTGEFYWKVWGKDWASSVDKMHVVFTLPKPTNFTKEIYVWVHPKLSGQISVSNNSQVFVDINGVPANQWVELHVLFPEYVLSDYAYAKINKTGSKESILAWEAKEKNKRAINPLIIILGAPLFMLLAFIIASSTLGKEPKVMYNNIYEREPPYNYSPALVTLLLNPNIKSSNSNNTKGFVAELLNLATKGYVKLNRIQAENRGLFGQKFDYEIILLNRDQSQLTDHEKTLLGILSSIKKQDKLAFSSLKKNLSTSREFIKQFNKWQKEVKEDFKEQNFMDKKDGFLIFKPLLFLLGVLSFVLILISKVSPESGDKMWGVYLFFVFIVSLVLVILFPNALSKKTKKGVLHFLRWTHFKKYLEDFGAIREKPPESIVLWEKYLVYAVSLGVASKVIKAMKLIVPNMEYNNSTIFGNNPDVDDFVTLNMAVSSLSSPFSMTSSSSNEFSGAGFSGGGGSAGGGGGGGFD